MVEGGTNGEKKKLAEGKLVEVLAHIGTQGGKTHRIEFCLLSTWEGSVKRGEGIKRGAKRRGKRFKKLRKAMQ